MSKDAGNKIHILLMGHDSTVSEADEEIDNALYEEFRSHITKKVEYRLKGSINFDDYDLILVKDAKFLVGTSYTLNQLTREKIGFTLGMGSLIPDGVGYENCCERDDERFG